jgi:hypothetical protein
VSRKTIAGAFGCLLPAAELGALECNRGGVAQQAKNPEKPRSYILNHAERISGGGIWWLANPNGVCAMRDAFSEWTISSDDVDRRIARAIRISVGHEIREMYSGVLKEEIPSKIAALLRRLDR